MHGMQEVTGSIPVISTRNKKHRTEMCSAFFVNAERVRVWLTRESAVHRLQEVTVIRIGPVISTRNKKHRTGMCGAFLLLPNE